MRIMTERYSFELPDQWKELVGVRKKAGRTDLVLLTEENPGCSGLLASIKCLKRRISKPDEYTEFLGSLGAENGENRFLYACYGREGAVSEENEDLYWRLRDQLWRVFESICPAEIVPLPKEEWKGTPIMMRYTTEEYFDLEMNAEADSFSVQMVLKKFDSPVTHTPEEYDFPDRLYQDHWENAEAWGIVSQENGEKKLLACIEVCPEEWSNRLMVTELWVADELHRQGIGTRLMNLAKEKAQEQKRRAIILETQSCNVRAIRFYRSQGFQLIGYDSCCYTNRDVERHEIRFNFGYFPDGSAERNL